MDLERQDFSQVNGEGEGDGEGLGVGNIEGRFGIKAGCLGLPHSPQS